MIKRIFPKIIQEVGFDFSWDNTRVWKLEAMTEEMDISELTWHFKIPFLNKTRGRYNLKPIDILTHPQKHKKEYERTQKADLIHPIDIMRNKGRWLILDGLHRLMKASLSGQTRVNVRKIPRTAIPKIRKESWV